MCWGLVKGEARDVSPRGLEYTSVAYWWLGDDERGLSMMKDNKKVVMMSYNIELQWPNLQDSEPGLRPCQL